MHKVFTFILCFVGALVLVVLIAKPGCSQTRLNPESMKGLHNYPYPEAPESFHRSQPDRVLRVLIWSENYNEVVFRHFEARYGIRLQIDSLPNNDAIYEALRETPERWDVIGVSDYMVERLINENRVRRINRHTPLLYKQIDGTFAHPTADPTMHFFIPYDVSILGVSFNIKYLGNYPRSWSYLSAHKDNPFAYGRIILPDDMSYAFAAAMLYLGIDPRSTATEDIEKAKQMLLKNARELGLRFLSTEDIRDELIQEHALMALTWSGTAAAILKDNADCRFLIPQGPAVISVDGFCIPSQSQDPSAGTLFIEFMIHPYNAMLVTNKSFYMSTNRRAMQNADRFIINGPSFMIPDPSDRVFLESIHDSERNLFEQAWEEVKAVGYDPLKMRLLEKH